MDYPRSNVHCPPLCLQLPLLGELMFTALDYFSLHVILRTGFFGMRNPEQVSDTDMACFKYMLSREVSGETPMQLDTGGVREGSGSVD